METQVYTVTVSKEKTVWRNAKGEYHRIDGPAIEFANGDKYWYQNGNCHRTDGPAIECADGTKYWYINGEKLTKSQFLSKTQPKELTMDEIAEKFGIPVSQLKIRKG